MSKPIRYYQITKIYRWGCPLCDYKTYNDTLLCMHTIKEHDLNVKNDIITSNYDLREEIE